MTGFVAAAKKEGSCVGKTKRGARLAEQAIGSPEPGLTTHRPDDTLSNGKRCLLSLSPNVCCDGDRFTGKTLVETPRAKVRS